MPITLNLRKEAWIKNVCQYKGQLKPGAKIESIGRMCRVKTSGENKDPSPVRPNRGGEICSVFQMHVQRDSESHWYIYMKDCINIQ